MSKLATVHRKVSSRNGTPSVNRSLDFEAIKRGILPSIKFSSSNVILAHADSSQLLRHFPDQSISLILTDPPYHSTKKKNIFADTSFIQDQHYLEWMASFAKEWRRILKPNGSLFCFCAPEMAARLEQVFREEYNVLAQIVWTKPNDPGFDGWKQKMKKEALRQWYPHSERIIFAEPAYADSLYRSYFGGLLRKMRETAGLTMHQLTQAIGAYGRVNHGGAVSNWEAARNVPSFEQYEKICEVLLSTGRVSKMPPYYDTVRPFNVNAQREFTDIWTFPSVRPYRDKHPAEKPTELLEHAIEATTHSGDIVLDCFSGSGSTLLAALTTGRLAVGIEIDSPWVEKVVHRLEALVEGSNKNNASEQDASRYSIESIQPTLFSTPN